MRHVLLVEPCRQLRRDVVVGVRKALAAVDERPALSAGLDVPDTAAGVAQQVVRSAGARRADDEIADMLEVGLLEHDRKQAVVGQPGTLVAVVDGVGGRGQTARGDARHRQVAGSADAEIAGAVG